MEIAGLPRYSSALRAACCPAPTNADTSPETSADSFTPQQAGPNSHDCEPPNFDDMKDQLGRRVDHLCTLVRRSGAIDTEVAAHLAVLEDLADGMGRQASVEEKAEMRKSLWLLRQSLSAGPERGQTPAIRKAVEKARNAALDNTWEASLKGIPSEHHTCGPRPDIAEVPNFNRVEPGFFRGGQPTTQGVEWLVSQGVKHEIDLRGPDRDNQWFPTSWKGVERHNIAVPDYEPPTFAQVERFLDLINDAGNKPVYVHCKAGIGRTGVMTACWRISKGMSAEDALKREGIHSYHGTLRQEQFVRDFETYWREKQQG